MLLTKLHFHMVRVLLLHGINFLGEKNSSADTTVEHAHNDAHLRALDVLADLGEDHSVGWDGRTPQSDQEESSIFL